MKNQVNRNHSIDVFKGIGIFFVVLGHLSKNHDLVNYVYSFHMPLFFVVSGVFFNPYKYQKGKELLKSRFRTLLLPYLIFYLILYLYWLFVERNFRGQELDWWIPITGLLYATPYKGSMFSAGPLWFLPCLFMTEVLYFYSYKFFKNKVYVLLFTILLFFLGANAARLNLLWLPFAFSQSCIAVYYYGLGVLGASLFKKNRKWYFNLVGSFVLLLIHLLYFSYGKISIYSCEIGNVFFDIWFPIVPILGYFLFANLLQGNKLLQYIGLNTLIVIPFHEPIYRFVFGVLQRLTSLDIASLRSDVLVSLLGSFLTILACYPLAVLWRKFYPKILNWFDSKLRLFS